MLNEIAVRNFKAVKDARLQLGAITVLIGRNGTGKSSVLQALALLKQSRQQGTLQTRGPAIDLGDFEDLVHKRNLDETISFELEIEWPTADVAGLRGKIARASYGVSYFRGSIASQHLRLEQPIRIDAKWSPGGGQVDPSTVSVVPGMAMDLGAEGTFPSALVIRTWAGGGWQDPKDREGWQAHVNVVSGLLERTYVVPPVRGIESSSYALAESPTDDFVTVSGPAEHASRALSTIAYRRDLEQTISDLSWRILEVRVRSRLIPGRRVSANAYNGTETNLVNEGFGANQLILLLAQTVVSPRESLLGIEEPEIHLHPKAQASLAQVFAEIVQRDGRQLILTTHSEHLLMGLLTEVANGRLSRDSLRVYYFDRDKEGVATVEALDVDERGQLSGGLKGFFETNIEELQAYLEALSGGAGEA